MVQRVKALKAKADDLSSITGTHVEGENPCKWSSDLHGLSLYSPPLPKKVQRMNVAQGKTLEKDDGTKCVPFAVFFLWLHPWKSTAVDFNHEAPLEGCDLP